MALRNEFKIVVPFPSPGELYKNHREEIDAGLAGGQALLELTLAALEDVFLKLRITGLEKIPAGKANVRHELNHRLATMLTQIKRGDTNAKARLAFELAHGQGAMKRKVSVDVSLLQARVAVVGVPPVNGIDGTLLEVGRYAKERQNGQNKADRVDLFTTGKFAQTEAGELLAVLDNSKIYGEPGIDVRGTLVNQRLGAKYHLQIGAGVEKKELMLGKAEFYSALNGVVESRYDEEGKLCFLGVDGTLRLGEVGFRTGGNVLSRGEGGRAQAISIETAEFHSIPGAFETRTDGVILVKETIQGKVVGASVTADMVNQAPGKFIVATAGAITVHRSVQGGFLYAPEIVIGNGEGPVIFMNCQVFARNRFTGKNLLLVGRNQLVLGNDTFREPDAEERGVVSGQDLFAGRLQLVFGVRQKQADLKEHSDAIGKALLGPIQKKIAAGKAVDKETIRRVLEETSALEKQFAVCPAKEEEDIRLRIDDLFRNLGVENPQLLFQRFSQKKALTGELAKMEKHLAAVTQDIQSRLHVAECKDGSVLTVKCWEDELLIKGFGEEMRIERPDDGVKPLYDGPAEGRTIQLSFDYETEQLHCEVAEVVVGDV